MAEKNVTHHGTTEWEVMDGRREGRANNPGDG
jgi:hypothetical protein